MSKKRKLGKVALGVALGAGVGILLAPKKGSETRRDLKNKMKELIEKVKNIDSKEVKAEFNKKIKELEEEIKELDKEKVINIAKDKASKIKDKANDLVELAGYKGNKTLQKSVEDVRKKAIQVTKIVLEKLETEK